MAEAFPGLSEKWLAVGDGFGSWDIVSEKGTCIAYDIPMGAYADHIVALHNATLVLDGMPGAVDQQRCFSVAGVHHPDCSVHKKSTAPVLDLPSSKNPEGE